MKRCPRFTTLLSVFVLLSLLTSPAMAEPPEQMEQEQNLGTQKQGIQELTSRMEQGNGQIPNDFTQEEMQTFLEQADQDTVNSIMCEIMDNATPVPMPEVDLSANQEQQRSNVYYSYDSRTKTEQRFTYNASDPNTSIRMSEGVTVEVAPESATQAYPKFWFELNPQNYYETKPTARVMIKAKDGSSWMDH